MPVPTIQVSVVQLVTSEEWECSTEEWDGREVREIFESVRGWLPCRRHQEVEIEVNGLGLGWVVSKVGLEKARVSHRGVWVGTLLGSVALCRKDMQS